MQVEKVKVTKVYRGKQETSYGEKDKIAIKTEQYGDSKWLSCFVNKSNSNGLSSIKEGQTIEIVVEKKGEFLNFRLVSPLDRLEARVKAIEAKVFGSGTDNTPEPDIAEDEDNSDIPF